MRITPKLIIEWTAKQIRQKTVWLETFGPKGPKARGDADRKQRSIYMLEAIHFDYCSASGKEAPKPQKTIKATEIVNWCDDEIEDRRDWLRIHGPKAPDKRERRPEMEVETKWDDLDILTAILNDYERAIKDRKSRS